jgi:carboxypeptidase C (cathepsin A)
MQYSLDGLFLEIGPFRFDEASGELKQNQYSWHRAANLLFGTYMGGLSLILHKG